MEHIKEEIQNGDFTSFDRLNESQKGNIAKNWTKEMKHKYLTRHGVMTEDEFFAQLDKIADGTFCGDTE